MKNGAEKTFLRPSVAKKSQNKKRLTRFFLVSRSICWSGKRDLNSRPSAWEADALPLNYSRVEGVFYGTQAKKASAFSVGPKQCGKAAARKRSGSPFPSGRVVIFSAPAHEFQTRPNAESGGRSAQSRGRPCSGHSRCVRRPIRRKCSRRPC